MNWWIQHSLGTLIAHRKTVPSLCVSVNVNMTTASEHSERIPSCFYAENVQKAFEMKGNGFIRKCNNFSNGRFVDIPFAFVHIVWIKEARPGAHRNHCECLEICIKNSFCWHYISLPSNCRDGTSRRACWLFKDSKSAYEH